jgi:DHA2 family multidrug resistance protein
VRLLILTGLLLTSFSLWEMTLYTAETTAFTIIKTGVTQGFGLGFIFVPLSTITFSTLAPKFRNEGIALFILMRNIGSSIGISVVVTYLSQRTQINHAAFADYITPFNLPLQQAAQSGAFDLDSPTGLAMINAEVTRQAATLAYLQDFRLMMWITLAAIPLVLLLRNPTQKLSTNSHQAVLE